MEEVILLDRLQVEHEVRSSSNYGIRTDYTKNIFEAVLDPNIQWPQLLKTKGIAASPNRRSWSATNRCRIFTTFTFEKQRHTHVYAWMEPEHYDNLTTGNHANAVLDGLMQGFHISEALVLKAEDNSEIRRLYTL